MAASDIQTSFAAGEISPQLYARVDLDKFQVGAALLRNFFVDYRGGATNRPGTKYIATTKFPQGVQRLIPFIVSTAATYVLDFGEHYIRFYTSGVQLETSPGVPYEVVTPYAAADLERLNYTQSADVLTLVHPSYPPANLSRLTDTTFSYALLTIGPDIDPPVITTFVAPHSGPYSFGYLVTAVDLDGKEESLPSNPGVKHSEGMNETTNRVIGLTYTAPAQPVSRYNIYKWGPIDAVTLNPATVWGYIGSSQTTTFTDNNIAPDFSKQPPGWGDPFSGGQFQSINVASGGSGYDGVAGDWPTAVPYVPLTITGDGTGASGYAVIDHALGTIIGVYLTNPGKNYTTATITANGQGGSGATFTKSFTATDALNPACTAYLQQRRWFAGSLLKPETIVASNTGLYNNFNTTPVSLPTDALVISLASEQVNTIRAMVPVAYGMLVFTTGGSFLLNGGAPYASISPATVSVQSQASEGANFLRPLVINYDILYGQAKGNRIRNLAFAWQRQSYTGSDVTSLCPHLFDGLRTTEWTWAEEPFKIVWAVRDDGKLLSLTYVPDQEVSAWCRHDTQGLFKSICSVPEGDTDAVYVIVQRHIDQGDGTACWVNYIERFAERLGCCIYDSWFLDSALDLPKTVIDTPLYLSGVTGNITITSYDPCLADPGGGPFGSGGSGAPAYIMEAKENYSPAFAAELALGTQPSFMKTDQQSIGLRYDHVRRKMMYSLGVYNGSTTKVNTTGFNLWSGQSSIADGANYNIGDFKNHQICEKDISSGVVNFYDCWSSTSTVPAGIGGSDGTYRRFVEANASTGNVPMLVDPRTGNVWQHTFMAGAFNCGTYLFRLSDNFAQIISPLFPPPGEDGHMEALSTSIAWTYVRLDWFDGSHHLLLTPRLITAPETAADQLLTYAEFTYPATLDSYYFRSCVDTAEQMFVFGRTQSGPPAFKLYKFIEPTSAPFGGPVIGGGFTDITPWAAGTGPNTSASAYTDGRDTNIVIPMSLPQTGELALISKLPMESKASVDPLDTRIDCTYFNIAGGTFDYHQGFVTGYMTSAWVPTTNPALAAWVVLADYTDGFAGGGVREVNPYLDQSTFDYHAFDGTDYSKRWMFFTVQPVVAGAWTPNVANNHQVLVQYHFVSGAAPVVLQVVPEEGWDTAYAAYGTAIGNANVVNTSLRNYLAGDEVADSGIYDPATVSFWWSGNVPVFQLNAPFDTRPTTNVTNPFLRLSFEGSPTPPPVAVSDCLHIGCGEIVITEVVNSTTLHGTVEHPLDDISLPDDISGAVAPVPAGTWWLTVPTQTFTGLAHLNNKQVWALADGAVVGPLTVTAGAVDLGVSVCNAIVGLKYTQQIQTLYLTMEGLNMGTEQGRRKQITGITLRTDCTLGPIVGSDFTYMSSPEEFLPANMVLYSGDARALNFPDWNEKGEICIQQNFPLPASILGVIVEVTAGDTGS